jgi:primosomal protein N'
MKAMAVSGETPKRELANILADYEAGKIDVLVNAQLLAEGWNSPRATDLHAPRADRLQAHLPAACGPRHAPPSG